LKKINLDFSIATYQKRINTELGGKTMSEMKKLMEAVDSIQSEDQYTTRQVVGHRDNETRMMQRALVELRHHTDELLKMMDDLDEGDYPHWWQAKLVKANDYIGKLKHFLQGELELGPRYNDREDEMGMLDKELSMDDFKDLD